LVKVFIAALVAAVLMTVTLASPASAAPPTPPFGSAIDHYAV